MKKRILIIGGTGFIGHNLIKKLSKHLFKITSISKNNYSSNKIKKVKYLSLDISKGKKFKKIKKTKFDIIVNLGGNIDHNNKKKTYSAHYLGCKNIIDNLILDKKSLFIQIGSSLEYGNLRSPQSEKNKCEPNSYYAKSKLKASKYIIKMSKKKKFDYIILRPYQVYGPYQKFDRLIPYVIKSCLKNSTFKCSEGEQLRDFLFIDDFVNAIKKIIKKKKIKSGIYNIGYGKPIKIKNIIKKINKLVKKGKPNFGAIKMRKDEINILYPKVKKIASFINWKPKYDLTSGLKKTISFYGRR